VNVVASEVLALDPAVQARVARTLAASDTSVIRRAPVRQALKGVEIAQQQLKATRAQRIPSIAATTNYQRLAYPTGVLPTSLNDFFPNWTVGIGLSFPIFTGGRLRGDILAAEASVMEARQRLRQAEEGAALTHDHRRRDRPKPRRRGRRAAAPPSRHSAYSIAEVFREGISTQLELSETRAAAAGAGEPCRAARDLQVVASGSNCCVTCRSRPAHHANRLHTMMTMMRRMAPAFTTATYVAGALLLGACQKTADAPVSTTAAVQMIGPDNIAVAVADTLRSGPAISGTLIADREARIRAEVGGAVLQTYVDAGQRVDAGTPLARIDDRVLQDAMASARSGLTQATLSAEQATRELGRAKTLVPARSRSDVERRSANAARRRSWPRKARLGAAEKNRATPRFAHPRRRSRGEVVSPGDIVRRGGAVHRDRSAQLGARGVRADVRVGEEGGAPAIFTSTAPTGSRRTRHACQSDENPHPAGRGVGQRAQLAEPVVAGCSSGAHCREARRDMVPKRPLIRRAGRLMRPGDGKVSGSRCNWDCDQAQSGSAHGPAGGDTVLLGAARGISVVCRWRYRSCCAGLAGEERLIRRPRSNETLTGTPCYFRFCDQASADHGCRDGYPGGIRDGRAVVRQTDEFPGCRSC
jgi:hypothetical protein